MIKFLLLNLLLFNVLFTAVGQLSQSTKNSLATINSERVEYAPSISANGNTMIFQSDRSGNYNLYVTHKSDGNTWSIPEPIKGQINDYGSENDLIGGPSLSYDGNYLYFFASFKGGFGAEDIYYSVRENNEWSAPKNIGKPINTTAYEGFPTISSDGKSLYFMKISGNSVEQMTCYTMMVSNRDENGNWEKPYPLPNNINKGCEKFPRIMSDNETLIFSSIRGGDTKNGFDLFETKYLGEQKWSEPVSMDFANTESHDYFGAVSSVADVIYTNAVPKTYSANYDLYSSKIPTEFKPRSVINIIRGDN